jgi:formyl-CoA transferase
VIDVPLYDSQVAWLANQNMNFLVGGTVPERMGTAHPNLVPYQSFATSDGSLMLAVGNDRQFADCMTCLDLAALSQNEKFADNAARLANRTELVAQIQERLSSDTTDNWLNALSARQVPSGPINDIGEVLGGAYAAERHLVRNLENGAGDKVPTVANPVHLGSTPVRYDRAPPLLGEHTDEVLREWLGYSAEQISELRSGSAI